MIQEIDQKFRTKRDSINYIDQLAECNWSILSPFEILNRFLTSWTQDQISIQFFF